MITHYTVEENIFVAVFYKLIEQQMYWNAILKIAFKLIVNKQLRCFQRVNMSNSKIMREENPNDSYRNIYRKHAACSYGYRLVCIGDKFNKSYLGEDAV